MNITFNQNKRNSVCYLVCYISDEKTDTLNNTQHSITSSPTDILTNPASTLTTSTDHVLSTTKGTFFM